MLPRSFQARLTFGFAGVIALTLVLVSAIVLNRLDDYFADQTKVDLSVRALAVRDYVQAVVASASDPLPVVDDQNTLNPAVHTRLSDTDTLRYVADRLGQADVRLALGSADVDEATGDVVVDPSADASFSAPLAATPERGQTREPTSYEKSFRLTNRTGFIFGLRVTLSNPFTFRASAIATATGLLAAVGILVLGVAFVVAAVLAQRFTTPLRRVTESARALAEGDLSSRVVAAQAAAGSSELAELARQFNTMAARLEESVAIIRRDRDRSRDFLADVSHELRTPIAALRTFTELLKEKAGGDPAARAEFLEQSSQQLERLDWLAQNLLELSRLDSGLVLLDLRPEDLRACVESAVEQAEASARRRGVELALHLANAPLRIRHDPQRIGQVVTNLVGNALKFTPRGGAVTVDLRAHRDGAQIIVTDTGVGIDAAELPRIFERFYRGSSANEARGSGSGLGLAIVKSIVDMHGGRIAVESRIGAGSVFTVILPRDPRLGEDIPVPTADREAGEPIPALTAPTPGGST
jgi:signal transduction histidine kinase